MPPWCESSAAVCCSPSTIRRLGKKPLGSRRIPSPPPPRPMPSFVFKGSVTVSDGATSWPEKGWRLGSTGFAFPQSDLFHPDLMSGAGDDELKSEDMFCHGERGLPLVTDYMLARSLWGR